MKLKSLLFCLILQGCAYTTYTTKLVNPIERKSLVESYQSSIELQEGKVLTASIGEELFVINRNLLSAVEVIQAKAPTTHKFPQDARWSGTHRFDDGNSKSYIVYTTPEYYRGNIGVILDENGILRTRNPLVQVEGGKQGRRWAMEEGRPFFTVEANNIDSWALRYGGKKEGNHVFEIINKHHSATSEILQTILIDDEKFHSGFIIRKVLIQGISYNSYGVISYQIQDTLKAKS